MGISNEKNKKIHCPIYRKDFKAVILKSAVSGAAVASSENLLKMQILRPTKILLKLWGFGSAIHVLTSSPGDHDARESLRTTALR